MEFKKIVEDDDELMTNKEENDFGHLVPDVADQDDDEVLEVEDLLDKQCEILKITPEQALVMYGKDILPNYWELEKIIAKYLREASSDVTLKLIESMKKSLEKPVEEKRKTLIQIKKGLMASQINEYILQIHKALKDKPYLVNISCPDWDNDNMHYAMIPACKKLLKKYSEMGLLGCLVHHNYQNVAHELYCFAYAKGKLANEKISFSGVDINDYKIKVTESVKTFWTLVDSKKD